MRLVAEDDANGLMARQTRPLREELDWRSPPPRPVVVAGTRVLLREWTLADADLVRAYAHDPDVGRYLIRGPAELQDEPALAMRAAAKRPRTQYSLAVVERETNAVIGSAEVYVDSIRHHRGELGYVLRRDMWGQGLATDIAGLLLRLGFDELCLHRLWATCDPANKASIRVLEKVGMQYEGLLREHYLAHDGTWRDAVVYAAVTPKAGDRERPWPLRRAARGDPADDRPQVHHFCCRS